MDLPAYIAALPAPPQQPPDFFGFGHTAEDLAALRSALKSRGIAHRIVHSGRPDPAEGEASAAPLVIWQELALPELLPRLEGLLNRCLLPARLAGAPVILLSQPPREAYHQAVSSAGLHRDREGLWQGLYLEQLASFWEWPAEEPLSPAPLYAFDENLDASQRAAVAHLQGPIRVLAPAGSGKTRTLINRVIHLLNQGVEAGRIVALAFNKKAADEMAARLQSRGIAVANRLHQPGVVVRTFHGFGYEIIRRVLGWSYDGAGEQEQLRLLMQQAVSRHHRLSQRRGQDALEPFLSALNRAKMELLSLDKMSVETEEESLPFAPVFEAFLALQ